MGYRQGGVKKGMIDLEDGDKKGIGVNLVALSDCLRTFLSAYFEEVNFGIEPRGIFKLEPEKNTDQPEGLRSSIRYCRLLAAILTGRNLQKDDLLTVREGMTVRWPPVASIARHCAHNDPVGSLSPLYPITVTMTL